jgi:hypothetical protein
MRIAEGKTDVEIWDVLDRSECSEGPDSWLPKQALERFTVYGKEGHEVVIVEASELPLVAARKAAG